MKDLVRTLLLGGALSVLAGGAIAKYVVPLHCQQPKCAFDVELGPSQTKVFHGYCDGYHTTYPNSNMICHKAKDLTCTVTVFEDNYWQCTCTNWAIKEQHTTINVYCQNP